MSAAPQQPGAQEPHSWRPRDLIRFKDAPPEIPEIGGLFYPRRRNLLSGPSESGKTWAALAAGVDEVRNGRGVVWVDVDEMGERAILERLFALGSSEAEIREHFYYCAPSERLTEAIAEDVLVEAQARSARLLVADSFNALMALHGLSFKEGDDVERFWQEIADPFCQAGLAFLVLDHVTKNAELRGSYAIGSERKQSGAFAHLGFRVIGQEAIVREGVGRSKVTVNKDRGAYFPRPLAGFFTVRASAGRMSWRLVPADEEPVFRPTHLMEKVSIFLETSSQKPSKTQVEENVQGKAAGVRQALALLVAEGYVREQPGPRGSTLFESLSPYREDEDEAANDLVPLSSPERDDGDDVTPRRPRPSSPPLKGDDGDVVASPRPDSGDDREAVPLRCVVCERRPATAGLRCAECAAPADEELEPHFDGPEPPGSESHFDGPEPLAKSGDPA